MARHAQVTQNNADKHAKDPLTLQILPGVILEIFTKNYKNFKISVYPSVIHTKRVKIVISPESTDIHNLSPGLLKDCGNIKIIVSQN